MKNGTPRGDGTSRYLRGADSVPTTYEAFRSMLLAGTLPVDLLLNPNGWLVQGTALNAANLLSDETAEKLGLTTEETQTVNQALSKLHDLASKVEGHTHPAGDVVSGVLDQARVPYLSDAERVVATVGPVWYNENRPGKSTITYTYPFSVSLDHIPKRVLLIICDSNELGLDNPYRLKGDGASATVDLTYDAGSGRFDAFVLAGKKDSQAKVNVTTVPCYLRNVNDLDRVLWLNGKRDDTVSPPEEKWDGYGGKAVFPFTYAGNQGAYTSLAIRVGKFRFDRSGVSLTVEVTSVGGQYDGFSVVGYVFD